MRSHDKYTLTERLSLEYWRGPARASSATNRSSLIPLLPSYGAEDTSTTPSFQGYLLPRIPLSKENHNNDGNAFQSYLKITRGSLILFFCPPFELISSRPPSLSNFPFGSLVTYMWRSLWVLWCWFESSDGNYVLQFTFKFQESLNIASKFNK